MNRSVLRVLLAALVFAPGAAFAHPGHGGSSDLLHGFLHPLGGIDHVLAMVTVGLLAAQLGRRALWLLPASFVGCMAVGGLLGLAGAPLPHVEAVIALSVVTLGAVVALGLRFPVAAGMAMIGGFAIFHGYAHGAEMPAGAGAATYAAGFVGATILLHLAGLAAGLAVARAEVRVLRAAGAAIAVAGAVLLSATI